MSLNREAFRRVVQNRIIGYDSTNATFNDLEGAPVLTIRILSLSRKREWEMKNYNTSEMFDFLLTREQADAVPEVGDDITVDGKKYRLADRAEQPPGSRIYRFTAYYLNR